MYPGIYLLISSIFCILNFCYTDGQGIENIWSSKATLAFQIQNLSLLSRETKGSKFFPRKSLFVDKSWKYYHQRKGSYSSGMSTKRFSFEVSKNDNSQESKTKESSSTFVFETGLYSRPHPAKVRTGGEDSSFILPYDVGVFDGVGGWRNVPESDAGKYSKELAKLTAKDVLFQRKELQLNQIDVIGALKYAVKENKEIGSCTATILSYNPDDKSITGLNLGDSGALIIRRKDTKRKYTKDLPNENFQKQGQGQTEDHKVRMERNNDRSRLSEENDMEQNTKDDLEVVFRSRIQMHDFNTPYQLGTNCTDVPEMGHFFTVDLCPDDIIILASDGMFDNLFDQDIIRFLSSSKVHSQDMSAYDIALSLGDFTENKVSNPKAITPWLLSKNDFRKKKDREITKRWSQKFSGVISLNKKMEKMMNKFTSKDTNESQVNAHKNLDEGDENRRLGNEEIENDFSVVDSSSGYSGGKRDDVTIVVCKYYEVLDE